jgi:hypothetical protein
MDRPSTTASSRLFHGEIDTFLGAADAMIQQYRDEAQRLRTKYQDFHPDDATKLLLQLERSIAQVDRCRQEYTDALHQMEQALMQRWSASPDEMHQMLAEALKTGDYSSLAL